MVTVAIDDALDAQLEIVSNRKGRAKSDVVVEALRQYVKTEQRKQQLQDPALIALYQQLADEDTALAEEGMDDYSRQLEAADKA